MIQFTEKAAKKIAALREEEGKGTQAFLRIEVKKGGCSGLNYKMNFDESINPKDKVFECFGERIVADTESYLYLIGMTLDYEGGLNGKGFIFSNPNAAKTCGCGSSFNI